MPEYNYLMIHCTGTPEGDPVLSTDIEQWHVGAKELPDGSIRYKGNSFAHRNELPDEQIGGKHCRASSGRGWESVGYSKMFLEDGRIHAFTDPSEDHWISGDEFAYGVNEFGSKTKHFVYCGGFGKLATYISGSKNLPVKNTLKMLQEWHLISAIKHEIRNHPSIKIIGHNQAENTPCPSFDVREMCRIHNIPEKNIDIRDVLVKLPSII